MSDAFPAAVWFVVNASATVAATRLCRRVFPDDTPWQIAMHAVVMLWASVVAICVLLGALGLLRWQTMGAVMLLASAAVQFRLRRGGKQVLPPDDAAKSRRSTWKASLPYVLWGGLAALAGGMVVERLMGFPKHWDDLMYHLPLVDHWLQDRRLYVPGCTEWYNPGNGELAGLWCVAPFSGDFWVGCANLPFVSLLALATVEFGRGLDLAPAIRHGVAIAALASNAVLTQLTDLENDMAVAASFAAAMAYGMRYARAGRQPDLWLAALSLALLAGVKYYALGYAFIAWLALIGLTVAARGRHAAAGLAGAALAAGLPLAGYWYVRNWLATGTPVFPLGLSQASDVLESVRPSAIRTTFLGNGRVDLWVQYIAALRQLTGLYQVTAVALIPTTAIWLLASTWFARRNRADRIGGAMSGVLGLILVGSIFVFGITPFTVADDDERKINGAFTVVRYSQCPVLLAMMASAVVLDDIRRLIARARWKPVIRVAALPGRALALGAITQVAIRTRDTLGADTLLIAANLALAAWLAHELKGLVVARRWQARSAAAAALLLVAVSSSVWLSGRWHAGYATNFDHQLVTHVFSRLQHEGAAESIAVADYRYYPFFGSRRQFRAHRPFRILSQDALLQYLAEYQINLLSVIRRDSFKYGRYRGVAEWAARDTARFEKFDSGASFDVYRVKKPVSSVAAVKSIGAIVRNPREPERHP